MLQPCGNFIQRSWGSAHWSRASLTPWSPGFRLSSKSWRITRPILPQSRRPSGSVLLHSKRRIRIPGTPTSCSSTKINYRLSRTRLLEHPTTLNMYRYMARNNLNVTHVDMPGRNRNLNPLEMCTQCTPNDRRSCAKSCMPFLSRADGYKANLACPGYGLVVWRVRSQDTVPCRSPPEVIDFLRRSAVPDV